MNLYAIFKSNLIGNLSNLHYKLSSVIAQMNCGPHPTLVNGHQISLSAYKDAKEDTATELKKAMTHLMYQESVLSSIITMHN